MNCGTSVPCSIFVVVVVFSLALHNFAITQWPGMSQAKKLEELKKLTKQRKRKRDEEKEMERMRGRESERDRERVKKY